MISRINSVAALFACLALASPSLAQQEPATPGAEPSADATLLLELNALKQGESGCQVTFLATNSLGAPLDKIAYEFAFFDASGSIDRLLALDLKGLAAGKTKVLQFPLEGLTCENIGRVLINNASACEGPGVEAGACLDRLVTSTKPQIQFGI